MLQFGIHYNLVIHHWGLFWMAPLSTLYSIMSCSEVLCMFALALPTVNRPVVGVGDFNRDNRGVGDSYAAHKFPISWSDILSGMTGVPGMIDKQAKYEAEIKLSFSFYTAVWLRNQLSFLRISGQNFATILRLPWLQRCFSIIRLLVILIFYWPRPISASHWPAGQCKIFPWTCCFYVLFTHQKLENHFLMQQQHSTHQPLSTPILSFSH